MPQEYNNEEFIRHVDSIVPPRSHSYKSPFNQEFAEIYIENGNGIENDEYTSQKISAPPPHIDEKAEIFSEMRCFRHSVGYSGGPYGRLQAALFYKQGRFMENFEDDYEGNASFSMYYPDYQSMTYAQLRTYFSWRTRVRAGIVQKTSLSYVFVYIYELINNIGVLNCEDGLDKLIFIWNEYRKYESKLDRYMSEWVKDYYITNDFNRTFEDILMENDTLRNLYGRSGRGSLFDFYYRYSDYKIKQSAFYTPDTEKLICGCFDHVIEAINRYMSDMNGSFDDLVFFGRNIEWKPFSKALYYPSAKEAGNKVILYSKYRCENEFWSIYQNKVCKKNGRILLGYILKRIEQFLRKATGFKHKLSADRTRVSFDEGGLLIPNPDLFFKLIDTAVMEYYRLSQRKIITVDADRLETIRANALMIQEKLLVNPGEAEEPEEPEEGEEGEGAGETEEKEGKGEFNSCTAGDNETGTTEEFSPIGEGSGSEDIWHTFARSLNDIEKTTVQMILRNASMDALHEFSKSRRMMLEVLVDNINQKAIESVGDNIMELSDEIVVFEEYKDDLERVIEIECH